MRTLTCSQCREIYEEPTSDAKVRELFEKLHPNGVFEKDCHPLCSPCFEELDRIMSKLLGTPMAHSIAKVDEQ